MVESYEKIHVYMGAESLKKQQNYQQIISF